MNARLHNRLFAACGIAFVALELGGMFLAMATGKTHDLTVTTSTAKLAAAIARPVGNGVWAGAYMELLSIGFFLAFAVWAAEKLGGGLLGSVTRAAAYANAGAGVGALAVMNTVSYQAGHGITLGTARTLTVLSESIYVSTWFLTAAFLTAAGILAVRAGRRALGWSAIAIVAYTLVLTPLSVDNAGQFSQLFWLAWVCCASVALARSPRRVPAPAIATSH
jgi:hypothetical protein